MPLLPIVREKPIVGPAGLRKGSRANPLVVGCHQLAAAEVVGAAIVLANPDIVRGVGSAGLRKGSRTV